MIKLYKAREADMAFVARVCREAGDLYEPLMPGAFERQARRYEHEGVPTSYGLYVVSSEQGPVGFLALKSLRPDTYYVVGLYFLQKERAKGYGSCVLWRLQDMEGLQEGKLVLLVHKDAYWAERFYKKNGFSVLGETKEAMVDYMPEIEEVYIAGTKLMVKM